jgi:hypothetical protein
LSGFGRTAAAQGPIFLTPPNTVPSRHAVSYASYFRRRGETDLIAGLNFSVRPYWTLGFGATAIDTAGGTLQFARVQLQTKLRVLQIDHGEERTVLTFSGAATLPLGESVNRVAKANGLSRLGLGVTAARLGRRLSYFANASYALDRYDTEHLSSGTLGVALGWRPHPAPPGAFGGPGLQFFGEALVRHGAGGSGWLALAPGLVYRAGSAMMRAGVRVPVRAWNSSSNPLVVIGTSMFFKTPV